MAPQSPPRILHTPILYRDKATRIRIICNQYASISSKLSTMIKVKKLETSESMVKMVKPVRNHPNPNHDSTMGRLNSGIFRIFELIIWNLNLNSSDCRSLNIFFNDIKLEPIFWELNLKNQLFNVCVSVWVGEHHRANFLYRSKDEIGTLRKSPASKNMIRDIKIAILITKLEVKSDIHPSCQK